VRVLGADVLTRRSPGEEVGTDGGSRQMGERFGHRARHARSEHERLRQRVAGEAVRPMYAGARDLARGPQAGDTSVP